MYARIADISKPKKCVSAPCHKCDGEGRLEWYGHVDGGICFRCGGSKVDPQIREFGFPADWSDERCEQWLADHERKVEARRQKAEAKREAKWYECRAANFAAHDGLESAFECLDSAGDIGATLGSIMAKVWNYQLSEAQAQAIIRGAERIRAKNETQKEPVPVGDSITVEGVVLGVKLSENDYGTQWKMLVEGEGGWKVWASVPKSAWAPAEDGGESRMLAEKGVAVSFVASVERSHDDPAFGIARRPRKFSLK